MADSFRHGRIETAPLRADQYRQVAEWAHGPQENVDWDDYAAYMSDPKRATFGIYVGPELVGCIWIEKISRNMAECHIATARRKIHPNALAQVLLKTAGDLFARGHTAVVAHIPRETRAAARLAIRCGLREWGHTPTMRYFILTRSKYNEYAQ